MLSRVRITNLGVIEDVTVDLAPGLNVLTGETGAGKTMVVTGLGLLLGARADAGIVRAGAGAAHIEGIVEVDRQHPMRARVAEAGGDVEDEEIVLIRSVSAMGRSRAFLGGRRAPVAVLNEVGRLLVAVHGQSDQWRLRQPEQHRDLLDKSAPATIGPLLGQYRACYERIGALTAERDQVQALERDRALESQILMSGLEEIAAVAPQPGEEAALRAEGERLGNAHALRGAVQAVHELLAGDDHQTSAVATALIEARRELATVAAHDASVSEFDQRLAELGYLTADLGTDLSAYLDDLEADPGRLEYVQQRRADLARLTRRFGDTCEEVIAWSQRAAARLATLDSAAERLGHIDAEIAQAREHASRAAAALHDQRVAVAADLSSRISTELAHLAMGRAIVDIHVGMSPDPDGLDIGDLAASHPEPTGVAAGATREAAPELAPTPAPPQSHGTRVAYGPHGVDTVEIRLAASPGVPARSVAKAASGGELSRVMLAIELITGRPQNGTATPLTPTPDSGPPADETADALCEVTTFVFDEVDAGIGGRAAVDVGARLAALAEHTQVIVVTHLAQVAAFANRHLVVQKSVDGQVTSSDIAAVEGQAQLGELARMMAGSDTDTALQHAAELRRQAIELRGRTSS